MADDKLAPAISAQNWQHLEQGATESAEKAQAYGEHRTVWAMS
jgi:hypothetical protein